MIANQNNKQEGTDNTKKGLHNGVLTSRDKKNLLFQNLKVA